MKLYEFEGKRLLAREGVATPREYALLRDARELKGAELRYPAMVKAQVLSGGRGKSGGVRRVSNAREAKQAAKEILSARVAGHEVKGVLIEEALEYEAALYLAISLDPFSNAAVVMIGLEGGVDIEQSAEHSPDSILRLPLDPLTSTVDTGSVHRFIYKSAPLHPYSGQISQLVELLARVYQKYDLKLLEINPLFLTASGPVAADAKAILDDNALYRQSELLHSLDISAKRHETEEPTTRERRAAAAGFAYVDLLPEGAGREPGKTYVGLVPGGAGYGIFSIDEIHNIGARVKKNVFVPLNFMDSGGGPTQGAVKEMFTLILDHPLVDLVITSRFGGISSCDIFIQGLVACLRERHAARQRMVPVYGRMVGTDLPAAKAYLEKARAETPEALSTLHMGVGNERIMAEVIEEGFRDFLKTGNTR